MLLNPFPRNFYGLKMTLQALYQFLFKGAQGKTGPVYQTFQYDGTNIYLAVQKVLSETSIQLAE
jgi:hypothetical protein